MEKSVAQEMRRRLKVIGLPGYISQGLIEDVSKWCSNSGEEWTVKRIKTLKMDLLRVRAGQEPLSWIRKNRSGGFYGWVGSIFRYGCKSETCFQRALQSLQCYTLLISPKLTAGQKIKVQSSISAEPSFIPQGMLDDISQLAVEIIGHRRVVSSSQQSLLYFKGSPAKKSPYLYGSSVPQERDLDKDLEMFGEDWFWRLWNQHRNSYCWTISDMPGAQRLEMQAGARVGYDQPPLDPSEVIVGNLAILQEPGYKVRVVASPFRVHQLALMPLGSALYQILKELPWDCTHDQQKAFQPIQEHLNKGKTVHAVDLSSATDYFPLELQISILREIFQNHYQVDLFGFLSRGTWRNQELGNLQWTKGQPMGLYPSFASFGLSHGLLLLSLCGGVYQGQFYIVGDDVVIFSDDLKDRYLSALELLGCPFSPDKTLSSNRFTEFAGKIITTHRVIPMWKWRKMSDDNFLDLMRMLGERARPFLSKPQRFVYDKVKNLLPPHGCNHSGGRSSLSDAVFLTEEFIGRKVERPVHSVVDLASWIHRKHGYQDGLTQYLREYSMRRVSRTFDEKVTEAYRGTTVEGLVRDHTSNAKLFPELSEVSGKPILPLQEFRASRRTTLDRYLERLQYEPITAR